jgi:hypothetical protein
MLPRGKRAELEEARVGVQQARDAIAGKQLPPAVVPSHRIRPAMLACLL